MKAMILEQMAPIEQNPLRMADVPDIAPGPGEVRIRVACCGVCRTDLHVIEGDLPQKTMPIIPGHQVVGRVDALGAQSGRFRPGDRIGIAWLRHTCGTCDYCRGGRENLCAQSRYTGYHAHGGYADFAVVPEAFAYALPAAFDDAHAAPLLCAGIVGYRALQRAGVPDGGTLAIYGFGSSAHIIFQIARHRGARIFVVTRGKEHQQLAVRMGAAWAGDDARHMPEKTDSAIVFAPVGHLVPPALEMLRKGGTLSLAGIHMTDIPPLQYEKHLFHERDIHSVTANTREDGEELLREAAAAGVQAEVTTYPLEEANRALQDVKEGRISGTAVLTN
jgi:alcohol dehydrogenase, propanol-preferring